MYGEGYDVISQLINNAHPDTIMHNTLFYGSNTLLIYLGLVLLLKVFATTATNGAGGCGGVQAQVRESQAQAHAGDPGEAHPGEAQRTGSR